MRLRFQQLRLQLRYVALQQRLSICSFLRRAGDDVLIPSQLFFVSALLLRHLDYNVRRVR